MTQHPGHAIHADESTYDGNWEVLVNVRKQKDWSDEEWEWFLEFFHEDLATREHLEGL